MENLINWEELGKLFMSGQQKKPSSKENKWDKSADMYDLMSKMESVYTYNQIDSFDTDKNDTVLDVGCGPGRISLPMAMRCRSVTALDSSEMMLKHCMENAEKAGLSNIKPCRLDWKEAVLGKNLDRHDIVIASRSAGMYDIRKLNNFARKYAVIICWANAPSLAHICKELFEGAEEENKQLQPIQVDRRFGYNIFFNIAYDMGLEPNVRIVTDGFTKDFDSREQAYRELRQLREIGDDRLPVFKNNVDKWLVDNINGGVTFKRETKTFVMWWKPKQLD